MSIKTAQTLTLVAGILFMLEVASKIWAGIYLWFFFPQLLAIITPSLDPATLAMLASLFAMMQLIVPTIILLSCIPSFIVAYFTLRWRNVPEEHKTGLIVIGILGLLFLGSIPGLLALIAGILIKDK